MTDNKAPIIKPIKLKQFECKQSNYEVAPQLPMRSLILSPSGGGKTVLLVNMIMDIYKGCFNRIYIFSPSVDIDHTWQPVKDHIAKEMKPNEKDRSHLTRSALATGKGRRIYSVKTSFVNIHYHISK